MLTSDKSANWTSSLRVLNLYEKPVYQNPASMFAELAGFGALTVCWRAEAQSSEQQIGRSCNLACFSRMQELARGWTRACDDLSKSWKAQIGHHMDPSLAKGRQGRTSK